MLINNHPKRDLDSPEKVEALYLTSLILMVSHEREEETLCDIKGFVEATPLDHGKEALSVDGQVMKWITSSCSLFFRREDLSLNNKKERFLVSRRNLVCKTFKCYYFALSSEMMITSSSSSSFSSSLRARCSTQAKQEDE
jgi:hypothetical protein